MTASGVTSSNGGTSLCGISTARMPARFAPCTSEKGRSPTKTHVAGSSTSSARITARKASGWGFAHGISLLYTAASIRSSTSSRRNTRSCAVRGQKVFDSTPTFIPRSRRARSKGATSGSVIVCGSQAS